MVEKDAIDVAKHLTAAMLSSGQYLLTKEMQKDADFASELFFHVYNQMRKVAVP